MPTKKGSMSRTAKPKSAKKGDDSSKTCSDIISYKEGLPPTGNVVLWDLWMLLLPIGLVTVRGRQPHLPLPRGEYVVFNICFFFILVIYWAFLMLTLCTCFLLILQFKNKDTSATRPILPDEPKVEVHSFFLFFSLSLFVYAFLFLLYIIIFYMPVYPFFLFRYPFLRSIPSPFSFTIP